MNRRGTVTAGVTAVAVLGIMGVAYEATTFSRSLPSPRLARPGSNPDPVPGFGRAPIPEVAVGPSVASGSGASVPPFPRFGSASDDEPEAATNLSRADLQSALAALPVEPSLSASERDGLLWMREEERLAGDVNAALARRWGNGPFVNVAAAEATHTEAVRLLLSRYGIAEPTPRTTAGTYDNQVFVRLYQELVTTGSSSYVDGLKVGARIEELDIHDLKARPSELPDIAMVYANLERASRNHLRAFVRQIERQGAQYGPTLLTRAEFDAIIGSDLETGASG